MSNMNRTDYEKFYKQYMDSLKAKAAIKVEKAAKETYVEYFEYVEKRVGDLFDEAIQRFYSDYTPEIYHRSSEQSMFKLIKTRLDKNNIRLRIWFEPSAMTAMRSGYAGEDGLYDQVFRKGWHGGADKIASEKEEKWGVHPNPGTPYWRVPTPGYFRWGREARIADVPPLEDFKQTVKEREGAEFNDMFEKIWEKNFRKIKIT